MSAELKTISVDQIDPELVEKLRIVLGSQSIIGEGVRRAILGDFLRTYGKEVRGDFVAVQLTNAVLLIPVADVVRQMLDEREHFHGVF